MPNVRATSNVRTPPIVRVKCSNKIQCSNSMLEQHPLVESSARAPPIGRIHRSSTAHWSNPPLEHRPLVESTARLPAGCGPVPPRARLLQHAHRRALLRGARCQRSHVSLLRPRVGGGTPQTQPNPSQTQPNQTPRRHVSLFLPRVGGGTPQTQSNPSQTQPNPTRLKPNPIQPNPASAPIQPRFSPRSSVFEPAPRPPSSALEPALKPASNPPSNPPRTKTILQTRAPWAVESSIPAGSNSPASGLRTNPRRSPLHRAGFRRVSGSGLRVQHRTGRWVALKSRPPTQRPSGVGRFNTSGPFVGTSGHRP